MFLVYTPHCIRTGIYLILVCYHMNIFMIMLWNLCTLLLGVCNMHCEVLNT